jgi:DNA-binding MarR family transcriptional regulator/GNAT superfamily N-acetyltransferase
MEYIARLGLVAIASRLRAMSERAYAIADQVYRTAGLQLQSRQLPVLRYLNDHGPQSVGSIAQAIGQTHSAVSQLADRLVALGWLRVESDPADGRTRRLAITAPAQAELRAAKPLWRAFEDTYAQHCRVHGIDLLHTLESFDRVLTPALADTVVARAATHARDALRIVPFAPGLREHFYRLNEAWLRAYFYVEEIDHRVLSDPEGQIIARGGTILFAALGDEIVGTCALMPDADGSVEVTKMGVDERRRGLGIGRALLEAVIAEFRRRKGRRLFLETNSKLEPALRLYESMGFERQPAIKPDSHYARADVYMVWRDPRTPRPRAKAPRAARSPRRTV